MFSFLGRVLGGLLQDSVFIAVLVLVVFFGKPPVALEDGVRVSSPTAFVHYCKRHPEQCAVSQKDTRTSVPLKEVRELLEEVQREVNKHITYASEEGDAWIIHTSFNKESDMYATAGIGDCDDYAVTKRYELIKRGVPPGALRLTKLNYKTWDKKRRWTESKAHLVLTVVIEDGPNLLLDNWRWGGVMKWSDWLAVRKAPDRVIWQSGLDPKQWVKIEPKVLAYSNGQHKKEE